MRAPRPAAVVRGGALRARRAVTNVAERVRRVPWPDVPVDRGEPRRVASVTVSYNSLRHTAHLLFSLFRVLEPESLETVVVVDNASTDGSAEFLAGLQRRELIRSIQNAGAPYHGPGLDRGINHLALAAHERRERIDYVWIVDSDVIVLRPDAVNAAVAALEAEGASLAGQLQFDLPRLLSEGYAHVSSNLIEPRRVWRRGIPPFLEHGAPGARMQRRLRDRGAKILDFPFYGEEYLLHLGRGTLAAVAERGERHNRYYGWAIEVARPTDPAGAVAMMHHFHGNTRGAEWYRRFVERFEAELPDLDPDRFADVCRRAERVTI